MRLINLYIYTTVLFIGLNLNCFASLDYDESTQVLSPSKSQSRSVSDDTFNAKVEELVREGKKIININLVGQGAITNGIIPKLLTLDSLEFLNIEETQIKTNDLKDLKLFTDGGRQKVKFKDNQISIQN